MRRVAVAVNNANVQFSSVASHQLPLPKVHYIVPSRTTHRQLA